MKTKSVSSGTQHSTSEGHPTPDATPAYKKRKHGADLCRDRGFHRYEEFIDPNSGGFIKCKDCGHSHDCEDPDGDLG